MDGGPQKYKANLIDFTLYESYNVYIVYIVCMIVNDIQML